MTFDRPALLWSALVLSAAPVAAAEPAVATIERFTNATLEIMKNAKTLGFEGRYKRFDPAIRDAFDLPAMTRFAVGPAWTGFTAADRTALTEAFARMTTATYAHNFNGFGGEKFVITPTAVPRGGDVVVKSQLRESSGKVNQIDYRMRSGASGWKAVDIYYEGGISQLGIRRSEFASTIVGGGAAALVRKLDAATANLRK